MFNRTGISLISAIKTDNNPKDDHRTTNGVGKSLIIELIHFCLGSKKISEFEKKIPGWEFSLEFEHYEKIHKITRSIDNQAYLIFDRKEIRISEFLDIIEKEVFNIPTPNEKIHKITRSIDNQAYLIFDGKEMKTNEFSNSIEKEVFNIPTTMKFIKFRSLLTSFIRRYRESYNSYDKSEPNGKPIQRLLNNSFLLGLDLDLIFEKWKLKSDKDNIKIFQNYLKKDPVFLEFFTGNKEPNIELLDLSRKIRTLESNLVSFEIAEDYHKHQKEANEVTKDLQRIRNQIAIITNSIKNIDHSLQIKHDINPEQIIRIYEETNNAFPAFIKNTIEEVYNFHRNLITNRIKRLTSEKIKLMKESKGIHEALVKTEKKRDQLIQFLGSHRALDEFVALTNELNNLKSKAEKLQDYKDLLETYNNKTQQIKVEMGNSAIRTNQYLKEIKPHNDRTLATFRSFSERIYPKKPGGLTIKNNDGDNQIRFDIKAKIEDDASDGINEVKIFCFDMTILTLKQNHKVDFLFHDSRLFSNMDSRQAAKALRIAYEVSKNNDQQYIATVNQDQIDSIRSKFREDEFKNIIEDSIILELTDEGSEGKLLGIQVDMDYTRK
ncbi:MAG: DUF2326 domain-containing protein [Candidatus Hatepunaea meridiana]|nr:DUF2326 domain-containing protein [Candidatus Hatepunaea meridiana]